MFDLLFVDAPPKPLIPSAVPMFTGRENEIEEISKLITDDSIRVVNIWGSPGFGKTSIAIQEAHHLFSLGYSVYFFSKQRIRTIDDLTSKILSIFKSNYNLASVDKLISVFREISAPVILIFDNVDDLLSNETSSDDLVDLFVGFLDCNTNINMILTTRVRLENLRDQVKGFQDVRIRPLSPVSSIKFVRQILPSFSESVVCRVAEISSHVPLAIKLVASSLKNRSEEMANEFLKELQYPQNRLEHFEKHMQKLFDKPFEQLAPAEKHALISLTVFSSEIISKDAAISVISREKTVGLNALRSLDTLIKNALIDEDPNGEYYSIHPLISTFILKKSKQADFENILKDAKVCFCGYYLQLFEALNDDFLAGKSINNPQLEDAMPHLAFVMYQTLLVNNDIQNIQHLFQILPKANVFFSLIHIPPDGIKNILRMCMHLTMLLDNISFLKLYVSYYFRTIAFSIFDRRCVNWDIPESLREEIEQLSDGTAAKLSCYEGIFNICNGKVQDGIRQVEVSLGGMQSCPDQLLLKCLCLQLLTLYYENLNELHKSCKFRDMAVKVCAEIGNCNLFLIADSCNSFMKDAGEPLILFNYLLTKWSEHFMAGATKFRILNFCLDLQQQIELSGRRSDYTHQILLYSDYLVPALSVCERREALLDEKIEFLTKSIQDCCSPVDKTFPNMPDVGTSERLLFYYRMKGGLTGKKDQSIEAWRKALELSLKKHGEQHVRTATYYYHIGTVECTVGNYSSALNALDKALNIMSALNLERDKEYFKFVGEIHYQRGITHDVLGNYELAISSFETALDLKTRAKISEDSKTIANILFSLGLSQVAFGDLTSALATLTRALHIKLKLFSQKVIGCREIVECYQTLSCIHDMLNNNTEKKKCLDEALAIANGPECKEMCSFDKCCIYNQFIEIGKDVNLYVELLDRGLQSLHVGTDNEKSYLPMFYLTVALKRLESGKHEAGIASLQAALDIEIDVLLQADPEVRKSTVRYLLQIPKVLVKEHKTKFCIKIINRALQLAESLPKPVQSFFLCRCYLQKGAFHNEIQEYVSAINFLRQALMEFSKENNDKVEELLCQLEIAISYWKVGRYKNALTSQYKALSLIRDIYPDGSDVEAIWFYIVASTARQLKNRKLVVTNLRLAYKMFSKVFGQNHTTTEAVYLDYVYALTSNSLWFNDQRSISD